MYFYREDSDKETVVGMFGPQAWYSEFGTGTKGQRRKHPFKGEYALNPYNSGKTIRNASEAVAQKPEAIAEGITKGSKYWTYKGNDGLIHYTNGIPSQRQVYDAGKAAKKELKNIVNKNMEKVFK